MVTQGDDRFFGFYQSYIYMQLKNIKISNIWSFPYNPNLNKDEGLILDTNPNGDINIIIWPNGSGKSTVLEVINQIFKKWICEDYVVDEKIIKIDHKFQNLSKHIDCKDKASGIFLQLELNEYDIQNLSFVQQNLNHINKMIPLYYDPKINISGASIEDISSETSVNLYCTVNFQTWAILVRQRNMNAVRKFILDYIKYFELIQICIKMYNISVDKDSQKLENLKNTFAMLGANRSFEWKVLDLVANENDLDQQLIDIDTKNIFQSALGYVLCVQKCDKISKNKISNIYKSDFWINLNSTVQKYLKLELNIQQGQKNIFFELVNSKKQIIWLDWLSSWEQSLLSLIMTVFGYDLANWTLIVDEPELHLHPQSEQKVVEFLDRASKYFKIQIIIATHSPAMITPNTIHKTIRIFKKWNQSVIYNRKLPIWQDEAELLQMLKYGNNAKIFFVDKIMMVEWETDMYFRNRYLEYLSQKLEFTDKIQNYEIIDIWGKGSYKKREKLLTKFNITACYVWDRDNVLDGMDQEVYKYKKLLADSQNTIDEKYKIEYKTQWYAKLIEYISDNKIDLAQDLSLKINDLRKENIFLLPKWDLETYIWLRSKWLEITIEFCHNYFVAWLNNPNYDKYRTDLEDIVRKFFV